MYDPKTPREEYLLNLDNVVQLDRRDSLLYYQLLNGSDSLYVSPKIEESTLLFDIVGIPISPQFRYAQMFNEM